MARNRAKDRNIVDTAAAEKRNTSDAYKGVRFVATFYNTAQCHNGGTASADFGMYILPYDVYEGLGGAAVTAAGLDAAGEEAIPAFDGTGI